MNKASVFWRRSRPFVLALLAIIVVNRLLAVSVIPVITNDSVGYISHSLDALGDGLVWAGYRQVGYPMYLAFIKMAGGLTGIEPVLLVAIVQRLLLAGVVAYSVWLFRWWSIPLVAVATAPDVVAYTNLVLTEGLTIPLAILYGLLLSHVLMTRFPDAFPHASRVGSRSQQRSAPALRRYLLAAAALVVVVMTLIKYQSVALVLPLIGLMWMEIRDQNSRKFMVTLGVGLVGLLTIVSGIMALENKAEYDDLFPISRGIRNGYWGTYQLVFNLHPENRQNPALSEIYADGQPFALIREIEGAIDSYPAQRTEFEEAIDTMLNEAGLDKRQEQLLALWGAVRGGRFDDIGGIILQVTNATTEDIGATIHRNAVAEPRGVTKYVAGFNDGEPIEPVLTAAAFNSVVPWHARSMMRWTGPAIVLALLAAAVVTRGARFVIASALIGAIGIFALLGVLIVDNYRYLITAQMYLLPLGTVAALLLFHRALPSVRMMLKTSGRQVNP